MVHTSKRTESATRQEALCQAEPRMSLLTFTWDETMKNPRIKLHSKYMKCSLIYCSSQTSTRIFIIRFWFPSRLERTLIWNCIFWSISVRCSLDNLWKLFSFFFFSLLVRALYLEVPFPLYLFIFSSTFYTWLSLEADPWTKSYFSRPFPSKRREGGKEREHIKALLHMPWLFRIVKTMSGFWPSQTFA